jgi:pyruvate dehydrogenase E2 component (dihydrolipoyllysine-residue acetyltransferase)
MATPVEVPKLGNTVEECLISRWVKRKGEAVAAGDLIAEIETDKATFELTAPVSGTVIETFFEEGALVPVFTNLVVIGEPGESADAFRPPGSAPPPDPDPPAKAAAEPAALAVPAVAAASGASVHLSPRARRFAREHHLHPVEIRGSGPGGRVLEEDVRKLSAPQPGTRISSVREKIARRMRESLASTAQYTLHASAGAAGLLAARARMKGRAGLPEITINDLVTFCVVESLLEVPALNAEFIDGRLLEHSEVHIGFACDTPRGLLVPVVRDAQLLAIDELAVRMRELAARAVQGNIAADDLSGATFTVSNLGGLGIESFTPLLNPPQVAILGVGGIRLAPARRNGRIEFTDVIGLSLTCDHQVIDGAPGARFLKVVATNLENVEALCGI